MKKIYFHIGPWKTGSTAIQYFLLSNKKTLEDNGYGIFYSRNPNSYDKGVDPVVDYIKEKGFTEWKNRTFQNYIDSTNFDYYIFSEELLYLNGCEPVFPELNATLQENQTTIILYARRVDNITLSQWKQISKTYSGYSDYLSSFEIDTYNYFSIIQKYLKLYPKANISVRSYEFPISGDIRYDFLSAIECKSKHYWTFDKTVKNPSITIDSAYALWYLKDKYNIQNIKNPKKKNVLADAALEYSTKHPEDKNVHILDKYNRQQLIDQMKDSTSKIEKIYYNGDAIHPKLNESIHYEYNKNHIIEVADEIMNIANLTDIR